MRNKLIKLIVLNYLRRNHKSKWGRAFILSYLLTKSYNAAKSTNEN